MCGRFTLIGMPEILEEEAWLAWLDPDNRDMEALAALLVPAPEDLLQCWEVSPYVNNPDHEGDECIRRVG